METACECEICGEVKEFAEIEWITRHYGVCTKCYNDLTPEEIDQIIEDWG